MKIDLNNAFFYLTSVVNGWNKVNNLNKDEPFIYIKIFKKIKDRGKLLQEMSNRHKEKLHYADLEIKALYSKMVKDVENNEINKVNGLSISQEKVTNRRSRKYANGDVRPMLEKPRSEIINKITVQKQSYFIPESTNLFCVLEIDDEPLELITKIAPMELMYDHKNNTTIEKTYKDSIDFDAIVKEHIKEMKLINYSESHNIMDPTDEDKKSFDEMIQDKSINNCDNLIINFNDKITIENEEKVAIFDDVFVQMDFYIFDGNVDIHLGLKNIWFNILGQQKPRLFMSRYSDPTPEMIECLEKYDVVNTYDSDDDLSRNGSDSDDYMYGFDYD